MNKAKLKKILKKHKKWVFENGGERADLRGEDLYGADLRFANLCGADLRGANLCRADLRGANLRFANLCGADLRGANLCGADLRLADLCGVIHDENTAFYDLCCPEKGSFVGFKKASGRIVELMITDNSKRSSATSRKCRCSEAVVLSITNLDGTKFDGDKIHSDHDKSFVYEIGKTVSVNNFNEDRWEECSTGIHFFMTRDEAVNYAD